MEARGTLEVRRFRMRSKAFGGLRHIAVILPPAYAAGRDRFPTLYMHDGTADWIERGHLLRVLRAHTGEAFITVMPEPVERTREYKLDPAHLQFMSHELVTWVDRHFRTIANAAHRAVHGVSLGGLCSVWLGLHCADVFGAAGSQGGAFWYGRQRLVRDVLARRDRIPATRFFITCGIQDGNLSDNHDLIAALRHVGADFVWREVAGRHSWRCWQRSLADALACYAQVPGSRT